MIQDNGLSSAPVHGIVRLPPPYYDRDGIELYCGDNCDVLGAMPRECVDLVVTSPPYDDLRTYGGHSWDFFGVAWQLKRVLKPGGVIVWIVSDKTEDGDETGTSWEQARHFKRLGLRLNDTMIWQKDGFMQPTKDVPRYYQTFEFMFVFSSGRPKFNPIRDVLNTHTDVRCFTESNSKNSSFNGMGGVITPNKFRKRENVWKINVGFNKSTKDSVAFDHPATFPEALARDHILSWSNEGDVVLDPFCGSGTTLKMAREMGRRGIGIEINEEYCGITVARLQQRLLFGGTDAAISDAG